MQWKQKEKNERKWEIKTERLKKEGTDLFIKTATKSRAHCGIFNSGAKAD